jgi:hypothetical protein
MTSKLHLVSYICILGLLGLFASGGLVWLGLQLTDLQQQFQVLQEAKEEGEKKDRLSEKLKRQIQTKTAVTDRLMKGQTDLLQAGSMFKLIHEKWPVARHRIVDFPGTTLEERACREVIHWVELTLRMNPEKGDPTQVKRLNAELDSYLAQPGGLRLPEPRLDELLEEGK